MRQMSLTALALILLEISASLASTQTNPSLQTYFKDYIGLSDQQIVSIRDGNAFAKNLPSRVPDEIFVFGAVHIHATPESYLRFSRDFDRLRTVPGILAMREFSDPPQLSDMNDLSFDAEDIKELRECKPGDCKIQMPASSIEDVHRLINWSDPNAQQAVTDLLQKKILERLTAYQRDGNQILGVYNDKRNPTQVPEQFQYMLSYSKALPKYLPDFYEYLLSYPAAKPDNVENSFYWSRLKFGLKPTVRVVHVLTLRGTSSEQPAYVIAEKQLYSSHYFQTALDLTFCVRDAPDSANPPGFYLIKTMGSEQAGLTGFKGSIVRKVAKDRSASSLQKSLAAIKEALEHPHS